MYIYWIALTLLLIAGGISSQFQHQIENSAEAATVDVISRSLLVYRSAAAEFARANPNFFGTPPESALNLPTWYIKQSNITTYLVGGVSYTFVTGTIPPGLPAALADLTESGTVGVNRSGLLYSPTNGNMAIPIPVQVPNGAAVAVF